jgi:hypothetical protein
MGGGVLDGIDSTWVPVAVIVVVAVLVVLRVRAGRITEFDRTPAQRWTVRIIDALAIAVVGALLLLVVAFVVVAVLAVPWPDLAARISDQGAWPLVAAAVVLFGLALWLTPQWFRPAHVRAMRDDEAPADDHGRRSPVTFDGTGRTYPDGSGLDPRDGS